MENLNRDELFLIATQLDFSTLLNFCKVSKSIHLKVCNNRDIWITKLKKDFSFAFGNYQEDPKLLYFLLYNMKSSLLTSLTATTRRSMYYAGAFSVETFEIIFKYFREHIPSSYHIITQKNNIDRELAVTLHAAIHFHNYELVKYLIGVFKLPVYTKFLKDAIQAKDLEILQYLYTNNIIRDNSTFGESKYDDVLECATQVGEEKIISYLIEKGANNWNEGLFGAIKGNNKNLFDYFISLGADNWYVALLEAIDTRNKEMIKILYEKSLKANFVFLPNIYDAVMKTNDKHLINFFKQLNPKYI
jgi:hypothetical protein